MVHIALLVDGVTQVSTKGYGFAFERRRETEINSYSRISFIVDLYYSL
jgi:hypothetical protein